MNMKMTIACICIMAGVVLAAEPPTPQVKMELLPEGAMMKLGGYMPQPLKLSATKPEGLKKSPHAQSPLYGTLKFGGASHLILLDEPDGGDAKLYVDANRNGDLTDDPEAKWSKRNYTVGGKQLTQYMGGFKLALGSDDNAPKVSLQAYRFDKNDPARAQLKETLFYYRDYARSGEIVFGEIKYRAMLTDNRATGDFSGKHAPPGAGDGLINLMIDRNSDGKYDYRSEVFDVAKPFNIGGTTWKVADLTADGSFKLVTSAEQVAEIQPPPDHSVGKTITPFKATRMDGTAVNFPSDYKGKLVMLDFWATWCGPCIAEVPGLVKAYEEFHPKGVEILGISLDQPNAADKVKTMTAEKNMTWPQVYDGKYWQAEIAQLYGINSIPAAYLVDGDTGKILAEGNSLRGENLAKTIKDALEKKGKK